MHPRLPYLEELNCVDPVFHQDELEWMNVKGLLPTLKEACLRTATLPSFLISRFVEIGFLRNINDLCVHLYAEESDTIRGASLDACLDHLAQLPCLRSLELHGYLYDLESLPSNAGASYSFKSLERLILEGMPKEAITRVISQISLCDLNDLSLTDDDHEDSLYRTLLDSFPNIRKLHFSSDNFHKLLYDDGRKTWNFPSLQELFAYYPWFESPGNSILHLAEVLRERTLNFKPVITLHLKADLLDIQNGMLTEEEIRSRLPVSRSTLSDADVSDQFVLTVPEIVLIRYEFDRIVPNLIWQVT